MALTRKFLSAMGIDAEKIDEIINAHSETVNGLKEELNAAKGDAEKLGKVQKELDDMKAAAEKGGDDPWEVKYNALKADYDAFKKEVSDKESKAAKTEAYRALLRDAGISEKRIDTVLKVSDIDGIELNKDGSIKNAEKLAESVKTEWADFITSESTRGAKTPQPPANNGGAPKSRDEIYKTDENGRFVYDAAQRQAALSQLIAAEQQKG